MSRAHASAACALVVAGALSAGCAQRIEGVDLDEAPTLAAAETGVGVLSVRRHEGRTLLVLTTPSGDAIEATHLRGELSTWLDVAIGPAREHSDRAATIVLVGRTAACANAVLAVHVALEGEKPAWRSAPLGNCRTPPQLDWREDGVLELRQPQRDDVVLVQRFDPAAGRVAARYEGIEPAAPEAARPAAAGASMRPTPPRPGAPPSAPAAVREPSVPTAPPGPVRGEPVVSSAPPPAVACPPNLPDDADRDACAIQRSLAGSGLYRNREGQVKLLVRQPTPAAAPEPPPASSASPPAAPRRPRAADPPALPPPPTPSIRRA